MIFSFALFINTYQSALVQEKADFGKEKLVFTPSYERDVFLFSEKVASPASGVPNLRSKTTVSPGSKAISTPISKAAQGTVTKGTARLRSKVSPGSRGSVAGKLEEKRGQIEKGRY